MSAEHHQERAAEPIRVSVVEDDARVRGSFSRLVDQSPGFSCVSQHRSAEDALDELPAVRPDVVLMDINLPGMSGVDCVRRLKSLLPEAQVVMLTVYEDTDLIFGALAAGATGYLLKRTPPDELLRGIRDVHRGGSPMTSHIARKVVQSFRQTLPENADEGALSPREHEVLDYLARGYLYKEIAAELAISYDTVHTYVRRIYEKLQVHSRTEAVAKHLTRVVPGRPPAPRR
ncbi:MAG TPA: response regulator transcription factor [Vicinamibacterales bacterium]|nr:response regulator transcription factor [Vicinamibacterales bacterium]